MGNNWLGLNVLKWLKSKKENIVGLIIHPPLKQKYTEEIIEVAKLSPDQILSANQMEENNTIKKIKEINADIGISVLFDYILKTNFIRLFKKGVINLHPSYLPYNRGQYPNVWSIIEGTPSGVSLHYIDENIDTGDIIAQKKVPIEPVDTGETLYKKLEQASLDLFIDTWPKVESGNNRRVKQQLTSGTYHRRLNSNTIDHIDLNKKYRAEDLINILRARTFKPYKGAYFIKERKRIYMRLNLEYGDSE